MSEVRIQLAGEEARFGKVPARDVARLLLLFERAVAQAASTVVGRPKTTKGRRERVVDRAARFRLRAIEESSIVPVLDLPEPAPLLDSLEVDVASLTETALAKLLDTAEGKHAHPVIASALLHLADELRIGDSYESVTFDYRSRRTEARRTVTVDRSVRSRLHALVEGQAAAVREDVVIGTLVEADFEKHTARLRGPLSEAVSVSFDEEQADAIQDALRRPASFQGKITYDADTLVARSVHLERISLGRQLILGIDADAFWTERSLDELADEQGLVPAAQPDELYDAEASEEEREAFMAALKSLAR